VQSNEKYLEDFFLNGEKVKLKNCKINNPAGFSYEKPSVCNKLQNPDTQAFLNELYNNF